jgi:hypothetical protein
MIIKKRNLNKPIMEKTKYKKNLEIMQLKLSNVRKIFKKQYDNLKQFKY